MLCVVHTTEKTTEGLSQESNVNGHLLDRFTTHATMMTTPPTMETMDSSLATLPSRLAPSMFPCSKLFLD
ncbi:hypothetical protein AOLI_G00138470 [Acnodon oligacanthus]